MTSTRRLYHEDSSLFSFTARVVGHGEWEGRPTAVLDATAFYPESGGQSGDWGTIGPVEVLDTQVDAHGVIHHIVDPSKVDELALGAEVTAQLDVTRRRDHMAQHTGQHMLSSAAWRLLEAKTVSSRLGQNYNTVDIDTRSLSSEQAAALEELVNAQIEEDLPVKTFFPSPQELENLPLRRSVKVVEDVRVVAIGDFDMVPCGGTHTARTSQVGLLKILAAESYKKKIRITFVCGAKARRVLSEHYEVLKDLGHRFTCHALEVPAAVDKLQRDLEAEKTHHRDAKDRLARIHADFLLRDTRGDYFIGEFDGFEIETLKEIAKAVVTRPNAVALLASHNQDGCDVFVTRHPSSAFDCGAFVKALAQKVSGRGGGRPEHAAGRLPSQADFKHLLSELGVV